MTMTAESSALTLFRQSVLKQQKWRAISTLLGGTHGLRCLDVGSDNGVVSYLLRARGGSWASADLNPEAVEAIRALVRTEVVLLNGRPMPFRDQEFDRVVLVDCLEHVQDDGAFMREVTRITKPGGVVLCNVPLRKETWLRRFRERIGQTDEAHGHVRPGYTLPELRALLGEAYEVSGHTTYSKFFSQALDTLVTWVIRRIKSSTPKAATPENSDVQKGAFITERELKSHRTLFVVYSVCYPFIWLLSQCDRLLWWRSGYTLLVKAVKEGAHGRA